MNGLLLGHYVSAAVRLHPSTRRYAEREVKRWLTALADGLAWQAHHDRSATDIQLDQWYGPVGQRAASIATAVMSAVLALPWIIVSILVDNLAWAVIAGLVFGLAVFVPFAPASGLGPQRLNIRFGWHVGSGTTKHEAYGLKAGLLIGIALAPMVGLLAGLGFGLRTGLRAGPGAGFSAGLNAGLAFMVIFVVSGLLIGIMDEFKLRSPQAIGPRDAIRAKGRYGIKVTLTWGLVGAFGLAWARLVPDFVQGLAIGFALGLTIGFITAADEWIHYHGHVIVNALRQHGPLRFGLFLDWAQQAGLLRVSGVAYQFRHRQLQDWLAVHPVRSSGEKYR